MFGGKVKFEKLEQVKLHKELLEDDKIDEGKYADEEKIEGGNSLGDLPDTIPDYVSTKDGIDLGGGGASAIPEMSTIPRTMDEVLFPKGATDNVTLKNMTLAMCKTDFNYKFKEIINSPEKRYQALTTQRAIAEANLKFLGEPTIYVYVRYVKQVNEIITTSKAEMSHLMGEELKQALQDKNPEAFSNLYDDIDQCRFDTELIKLNNDKLALKSEADLRALPIEAKSKNAAKRLILLIDALKIAEKDADLAYRKFVAPGIKMAQGGEKVKWHFG